MTIKFDAECGSTNSLEDYMIVVDVALAKDTKHFHFFQLAYDALCLQREDVLDNTMYDMLINFKDRRYHNANVNYVDFVNGRINALSIYTFKSLTETLKYDSKLLDLSAESGRNIVADSLDVALMAGYSARAHKETEHFAHTLFGYKLIREQLAIPHDDRKILN